MTSAAPIIVTSRPLTPAASGTSYVVAHLVIRPGAAVMNIAFSPNGRLLDGASDDGTIILWELYQ